jgi:hypothetical protein
MRSVILISIVVSMEDVVLPGDVDAGAVIILPGGSDAVVVKKVRLGQGGFIFTVASADNTPVTETPATERVVTLTAYTQLRRVRPGSGAPAGLSVSAGSGRMGGLSRPFLMCKHDG